jgi:hypothetical protein
MFVSLSKMIVREKIVLSVCEEQNEGDILKKRNGCFFSLVVRFTHLNIENVKFEIRTATTSIISLVPTASF